MTSGARASQQEDGREARSIDEVVALVDAARTPVPAARRAATRQDGKASSATEAFRAEAGRNRWCMACWEKATQGGRFPRLGVRVRHRSPANCPQAAHPEPGS